MLVPQTKSPFCPDPHPDTHIYVLLRFHQHSLWLPFSLSSVFSGWVWQGSERTVWMQTRHGIYNFVLVTFPSTRLTSKTQTEPAASRCRQHHFSKTTVPGNHSLQTSLKYTNSPYSAGSDKLQVSRLSILSQGLLRVSWLLCTIFSITLSEQDSHFCIPIIWTVLYRCS